MKMPSKVTDYRESTLANLPKLLKRLNKRAMNPQQLFNATRRNFDDVGEFVESLDCLFILGKIYLDKETGVIHGAKTD
nr:MULTISPECIES: ABC-three component system middle component 7 [unclassified Lactobacillus]